MNASFAPVLDEDSFDNSPPFCLCSDLNCTKQQPISLWKYQ